MAVELPAILALRVDNSQAIKALNETGAAVENVTKKTANNTVTTEGARKAWERAGGDMTKFGRELQKMLAVEDQVGSATKRLTDSTRALTLAQIQAIEIDQRRAPALKRLTDSTRALTLAQVEAIEIDKKLAAAKLQIATVAPAATLNIKGLAGAMGTLAFGASALPGSLGKIGSILGTFALGSGPMVAILAGLAAIAMIWERITRGAREAKAANQAASEHLQSLGKDQRFGAYGATPDAITRAGLELNGIRGQIAGKEALIPSAGILARGTHRAEIAELRKLEAAKIQEIQYGVNEQLRIYREANQKIADDAKDLADKRIAEERRVLQAQRDLTTFQGDLMDAKNGGLPGLSMMRSGAGVSVAKIQADMSVHLARFGASMTGNLAAAARLAVVLKQLNDEEKKTAAMGMLRNTGLSMLSTYGGAIGGIGAAALQGGMTAGPWGAAAGGVSALVSGILGMGDASRQAAIAMKVLRTAFIDTILAWNVELGLPGAGAAAARARTLAETQAERDRLDAMNPFINDRVLGRAYSDAARKKYQDDLDIINRKEKDLIDKRVKEADAIDKLTGSMVNMVQGYKLQAAIFGAANPRGGSGRFSRIPPAPWSGGGGDSGDLTVPVVLDGQVIATAVLRNFKRQAQQRTGSTQDWAAAI